MKGLQYEELCRFFLANKLDISVGSIKSVTIPNPKRPGLPEYKHQIDLYWEDGNEVAQYLNIANAKWRSSGNVNEGEVLLLQKVKEKVGAHKSMMITSIGFDKGAKAAAEDEGVALHIVCPNLDCAKLHPMNRETIQTQLREFSNSNKLPYTHEIIHRAFDFETVGSVQTSVPNKTNIQTKEIKQTSINRIEQPPSNRRQTTNIQKVQTRQGTSQTGRQGGQSSGHQGGSGPPKGTGSSRGGGGTSNRRR